MSRAIAAAPESTRVLLDANGAGTLLSLKEKGFPMVIALGPEGGLADDERDQM
ncbi:MAG: hypothetical protein ABR611_16545, partial [Chthoniobacterales bacterium]